VRQTYPDGGTREQAIGYHRFVLQLFLVAAVVARATGDAFPAAFWERLGKMTEFLGALGEGGDVLPMFGDCDDAYVLDLNGRPRDADPWLAVSACLLDRPDLAIADERIGEPVHWLPDIAGQSPQRPSAGDPPARPDTTSRGTHAVPCRARLQSRAFPETGYYLLQHGKSGAPDAVSVVFDCGDLGMKGIAAHAHADALSLVLRVAGRDILVDPGTYDYFSYPQWRPYFRSTRAHNTVVVDGHDQSEMSGPFLWRNAAAARCLRWGPTDTGGTVTGEHDGYARLNDPVVHRRTLSLDGSAGTLDIEDEIEARGVHHVEVCFHLAEDCRI
jgi:hypothetical protein